MIVKECHVTAAFLFVFVLSCTADGPRAVVSENAATKGSLSTASVSSTLLGALQPNSDSVTSTKKALQGSTPSSILKDATSSEVKSSTVKPDPDSSAPNETINPDVKPSTVKPDPDIDPTSSSTDPPTTKSTSPVPTTKPTVPPTTPPTSKPTSKPTSTPGPSPAPTTTPAPAPSPSPTSPTSSSTTAPTPTTAAPPHHSRHFDGPSFIGGIILASGLMAIGFVAFKFYKARTERNYHTL